MAENEGANAQGAEGEGSEGLESFSREEMSRVRTEAKNYRLKLRETEGKVEDLTSKIQSYEDANKSKEEKLASEKTELEKELESARSKNNNLLMEIAVNAVSKKLNIIDPEAAFLLIQGQVSIEDGEVKGVDKALKDLVKEKPYLVGESGKPIPEPGTGTKPVGGSGENSFEKIMLGAIKPS